MAPPSFLGPPELHNPIPEPNSGGSFVDLLTSNFNTLSLPTDPKTHRIGFTENNSPTFLSSGNPCLDFFFHVVPDTPPESIFQRLKLAWDHNPLTTLKLICNLRGVRGTGKNDKESFYSIAFWLYKNHPKTLACNVASFADFGYFKDLPEILYRLLEGPEVRRTQKAEWLQIKGSGSKSKGSNGGPFGMRGRPLGGMRGRPLGGMRGGRSLGGMRGRPLGGMRGRPLRGMRGGRSFRGNGESARKTKGVVKVRHTLSKEVRVKRAEERAMREKEKAKQLRNQKRISMAKKVVESYVNDPHFMFLYEQISNHFAQCLKADIGFLKSKEYKKISLAAKWCPSIDSSFDRSTLLCESIARKVFPQESYPEYQGIEEAHYAYRVRDRLRKEILVPLRKALELPEVYIGANRWDLIPYNRVASVAMKFYRDKFLKHDRERFQKYLEDVRAGKSKIAAGALLPHEIIGSLYDRDDDGEVAELQWKRIVDDLLNEGKLKSCLAVSDVSGSMFGTPMEVSVALGLLVSELSEDPWKGKIITFSENPQLHVIQGEDLRTKAEFVRDMDWGRCTNFQKVFDLILQVAVNGNLEAEQMIKKVFVFSDMEFDQASETRWETDYEAIRRKFGEKGYEEAVPEIVFWNLRNSRSTPVDEEQEGVALVSGFSKNFMNLFLDCGGEIDPEYIEEGGGGLNPESTMELAISGEEYQKLVVVD